MTSKFVRGFLVLFFISSFWPKIISFTYGDDVTITTYYPSPYAQHTTATTSNDVKIQNPFTSNTTTSIYGNATVNGSVTITNSLFTIAPLKGPYGDDGLDVATNGKVSIGNHYPVNSLLTAHTRIKAKNYYAFSYDTSLSNYVYAYGEAEDNTALDVAPFPDNGKRALFGSRKHLGGTQAVDIANDVYIPMRIEASEVHLGIIDINKNMVPPPPISLNLLGAVDWIGIGKDRDLNNSAQWNPGTDPPTGMLLEVNGVAWTLSEAGYSSREMKKDIIPLSMADSANILSKLRSINVVHFSFKEDPQHFRQIGIIAEDSPKEIITEDGKHLSTTDALGFLAAAIQELKRKNDELKIRIEKLEERKKLLLSHAKTS